MKIGSNMVKNVVILLQGNGNIGQNHINVHLVSLSNDINISNESRLIYGSRCIFLLISIMLGLNMLFLQKITNIEYLYLGRHYYFCFSSIYFLGI
jgi:hypothetical protein